MAADILAHCCALDGGLACLLGTSAARLAYGSTSLREPFSLKSVRRALLAKQDWLWVTSGEDGQTWAVGAQDGACLPWPSTIPVESVLYIPKLGLLLSMCHMANTTICAWDQSDVSQVWQRQTGMKVLPPLFYVEQKEAICAGSFDGVFMWSAWTGVPIWQARTAMPVDRIWHSVDEHRIFARTSEVLGLASELLVWDAGLSREPQVCEGVNVSDSVLWRKHAMEMIMALLCHRGSVFARIGGMICAWSAATGADLWSKRVDTLPRLPTSPTYLLCWKEMLLLGVGNQVLIVDAKTSQEIQRMEIMGSLVRLFCAPDLEAFIGVVRSETFSVVCWDVATTGRQRHLLIAHKATRVRCVASKGHLVYVGTACDDDKAGHDGAVAAWDAKGSQAGPVVWRRDFDEPVVSLLCAPAGAGRLFVGGSGQLWAMSSANGSLLWVVETGIMAKGLTLVSGRERLAKSRLGNEPKDDHG